MMCNQHMPSGLVMRRLSEQDLPLMLNWLNQPHLQPFYTQGPVSEAEVADKYLPRIGAGHPCHPLIAELDGTPFGYTQWYRNCDFPEYGVGIINEPDGVSLDYFIGCNAHLGQGLGPTMLRAVIAGVSLHVAGSKRLFFVGHHSANSIAIACSKRAGFVFRKIFVEDGKECRLYWRRAEPTPSLTELIQ